MLNLKIKGKKLMKKDAKIEQKPVEKAEIRVL